MNVGYANPVLSEIIWSGEATSPDGRRVPVAPHSIDPLAGKFLRDLVMSIKAERSLEVGLAFGVSALFISDALQKTSRTLHHVIDPYQYGEDIPWSGIGIHNLKMAGYEKIVRFHEKPSSVALVEIAAEGCSVDFAFIDGMHTFDHTLVDFFLVDRILRVGGIVAFDDLWMPSVAKVCSFIEKNRSYAEIGRSTNKRCIAFRKEAADSRRFDFHRDF